MPKVVIDGSNDIYEVPEGSVLYDSLTDQGVTLPHGCLSGSCGACRVDVLSGQENLAPMGYVENDTVESLKKEFTEIKGADFVAGKNIRLSCRAKVLGDVTIKPIKL